MRLTVLGSGDAFGSGGRLQTSFHIAHSGGACLVDCGATSLIGMARCGLNPDAVATIFITHLHGDHFGGLVWWLIHALHVAKRASPLVIVGPQGIEERLTLAAESLFPGSMSTPRPFALNFRTFTPETPLIEGGVTVTPFVVSHPSGATPYALRCEADGRIITYSGDTEWVDALVPASAHADLFIVDCYAYAQPAGYHMNWQTIERELPRLTARRVMLTHMGHEMLAARGSLADPRIIEAEDGLRVDV